ncbi:MAG TPA: MBOAT family O-acyltransferase, partial [Methylomirabilota bacterium]|nr:MBOAT family O-acyltransferase [Methylomirabilota bacterium]
VVSLVANLGLLGFFKYCDFFIESFAALLDQLGLHPGLPTLGIILPAGISFYTFQTMSYTIDVYRREMPATRDLVQFLAYVSFFPQLVAGPIERARHLLPQFEQARVITRAMLEEGVALMVWGLFKKVVLADNLAPLAQMVYGDSAWTGPTVVLGTIAFGLQIYCDFSAYSDIARGTARILGFDIMVNFHRPYAATSLSEFWHRWHISLSTWLRDYLYIPLGGSRRGRGRTYANLIGTMLLGGLWHGAGWHFVLWGLWHGIGLALERAVGMREAPRLGLHLRVGLRWLVTMVCVFYGWLLFRAPTLDQIVGMTRALADFSAPAWLGSFAINLAAFGLPLIAVEVWQARAAARPASRPRPLWLRMLLQGAMVAGVLLYWERADVPFIYFQF